MTIKHFSIIGIVAVLAVSLFSIYKQPTDNALSGGSGTINQLSHFIATGGNIKLSSSTAGFQIPSLPSETCIGTDANGVLQTGTCGGGGGSSLHTDATTYIYPTGGKYHSAPYYVATSSTRSTFTGGLSATASSTIGGGTTISGLTVSGGATTTLLARFLADTEVRNTQPFYTLHETDTNKQAYVYLSNGDMILDTQAGSGSNDQIFMNADVDFNGFIASNLTPRTDSIYSLGNTGLGWGAIYVSDGGYFDFGDGSAFLAHNASTDAIQFGTGVAPGIAESYGNFDLRLQTGNSTTGYILIENGSGGDINLAPNGTGVASTTRLTVHSQFTLPQGTAPTVDSAGEIAYDTTDNQLIVGASAHVVPTQNVKIWSATIGSTTPAFISGGLLKVPTMLDGYTMTAIRCSVQDGTSKVIAVEDESANSTEDITCATSVTSDDGSITNATVTAGEEMYIDFGATTGSVNNVSISVFGNWTRE